MLTGYRPIRSRWLCSQGGGPAVVALEGGADGEQAFDLLVPGVVLGLEVHVDAVLHRPGVIHVAVFITASGAPGKSSSPSAPSRT